SYVGRRRVTDLRRAKLGRALRLTLVDHEGFARADDVASESSPDRKGFDRKALAVFEVVRHRHHRARPVAERDRHVPRAENLGDLVTDEVDDGLEVKLGGQTLLHTVDDREFGRTLLALLEQPLRLVKEACVLERNAHAVRERL